MKTFEAVCFVRRKVQRAIRAMEMVSAKPSFTLLATIVLLIAVSPVSAALPSYQGATWKKVYGAGSLPGVERLDFRSVTGWDAKNAWAIGKIDDDLLICNFRNGEWSHAKFNYEGHYAQYFLAPFSPTKALMQYAGRGGHFVSLVEGGSEQQLCGKPGLYNVKSIHPISEAKFYLHCNMGWNKPGVFEVNNGQIEAIAPGTPETFVRDEGGVSAMDRAHIGMIGVAADGTVMGVWQKENSFPCNWHVAVVYFDGTSWQTLAKLPSITNLKGIRAAKFLSKDLALVVEDEAVWLAQAGKPVKRISAPSAISKTRFTWLVGIGASSERDVVVVDNFGGVYRCNGAGFKEEVPQMKPLATVVIGNRAITERGINGVWISHDGQLVLATRRENYTRAGELFQLSGIK